MTQENKELLLTDFCARLPYRLKYNYGGKVGGGDYTMNRIDCNAVDLLFPIENVKPYLFPLSSMTEEEKLMYEGLMIGTDNIPYMLDVIDWLNSHHFDYRGLIEKGLAIDATGLNLYSKYDD